VLTNIFLHHQKLFKLLPKLKNRYYLKEMFNYEYFLFILAGLWLMSGIGLVITGPMVLYRLWQWEPTSCQTDLLVESAYCKNCKVVYDVDNEPHERITYKNGCPTEDSPECWYNHSNNAQVTFDHPLYDQSWATWPAFQVVGITFAITSFILLMVFFRDMSNEVSYDCCGDGKCHLFLNILAVISVILFICGMVLASMVAIDDINWEEYPVCEVQLNFTNEGCETCYVQTPERHVFLDSCPVQDWICWSKKDNPDIVTFNDPTNVQNYNNKLASWWCLGLGVPGIIYGGVLIVIYCFC